MPKFQSLKGFRDFYPEDFAKRAYIADTWRRIARQHGFIEYDAPPLESLELYRHKSGDELVGQLYSFVDKGGREVALRPEMTPSVARMVSARWQSLPKPVKWFSIPQLFRYERPQAGRLREHFQLNADIFGDASPKAEAEILALVIRMFKAFGLGSTDVTIRLSDRRVLNEVLGRIGVADSQINGVYTVLDKLHRVDRADSVTKLERLGLSADVIEQLFASVAAFGNATDNVALGKLLGESDAFTSMLRLLTDLVVDAREWIKIDLTIVRGLGYYTGTVFEAFDAKEEFRAICGGGRYDGLLESLGGTDAPAIGFGWGDVVLTDLLDRAGKFPAPDPATDIVVAVSEEPQRDVSSSVRRLWDAGVRAGPATVAQANKWLASGGKGAPARFVCVLLGDTRLTHSIVIDVAEGKSYRHAQADSLVSALEDFHASNGRPPGVPDIRVTVQNLSTSAIAHDEP